MHMRQCPKFETCSANLCPLDPDWEKRRHVNGDPICIYMRESVKHGAALRFLTCGLDDLFQACAKHRDPICEKWPVIGAKVAESASKSPLLRKGRVPNARGQGSGGVPQAVGHPWKKPVVD